MLRYRRCIANKTKVDTIVVGGFIYFLIIKATLAKITTGNTVTFTILIFPYWFFQRLLKFHMFILPLIYLDSSLRYLKSPPPFPKEGDRGGELYKTKIPLSCGTPCQERGTQGVRYKNTSKYMVPGCLCPTGVLTVSSRL
jgi:hypothetical protein